MTEHKNSNPHTNATYNVRGVDVPGAQVEPIENIQPQSHQLLPQQQLQHDSSRKVQQQQSIPVQYQQHQQYFQKNPTRDPRQFDQQYQQSFYTQPTGNRTIQTNSAKVDAEMAAPAVVPANTNVVGDGSPGFSVGGVGVPGARVETLDSMQPKTHYQQQPPQQPIQQHQEQYIQQQHVAGDAPAQQSFFSQPVGSTTAHQQYAQDAAPVHHSTKDATNFYVGGLGAPGGQVEYLPSIEEQQSTMTSTAGTTTKPGELDTVQHTSASRPPVGPFDPPAEATTTEPPAPPSIFLQREASIRHDQETPAHTTTASTTLPSTEATPQHKIHIASSSAVAAAAAAQAADAATRGRRRSSLAVLADKIRSSTSRSRSSSLSRRLSRTISRHSSEDGEDDSAGGPYRDVKIAQQEHLAKLRAEQEKNGITHNIDGLPIPPAPERQRRRSSVSHILGLDKPLLSR
ncbi:hypothetical protein BG015_008168 [Linnemannia schmuckeri]|uniref:Uncharacterized protein n=1 Tax=Linnemannia schmuckeri TaxID=64567 RepID=A0A9P5RXW8_9FUNG|nr:hypothetical protein BG015_008168 [Linnemannia schmuckeri]